MYSSPKTSFGRAALLVGAVALAHTARADIFSTATPIGLDVLMGTPLLAVPGDGMPIGTEYGHPPTFISGIPLPTPIGPMGFGPSHTRITPGSPTSSGAFKALASTGPIAGSTVFAPVGATAIDFFLAHDGIPYSFEITAVGTSSTATIVVPASPMPVYVGFGAFGEHIEFISIIKLPFPSPTTTTWVIDDIRVLVPAPGSMTALGGLVCLGWRRRR